MRYVSSAGTDHRPGKNAPGFGSQKVAARQARIEKEQEIELENDSERAVRIDVVSEEYKEFERQAKAVEQFHTDGVQQVHTYKKILFLN